MTIDEELSIIKDNIAEYGQTNITQEEYNMIYNKAIDDFLNELPDCDYVGIEYLVCTAEKLKGDNV